MDIKSANFCLFLGFNFANLSEIPSTVFSLSNVCDTILSNIKLLRHGHFLRFQITDVVETLFGLSSILQALCLFFQILCIS